MSAVRSQLPILQVVVPLLGAVLAAFLRRGTSAFALMLAVSWLLPFISVAMLLQVLATGPISYAVGGWPPPIGIEVRRAPRRRRPGDVPGNHGHDLAER